MRTFVHIPDFGRFLPLTRLSGCAWPHGHARPKTSSSLTRKRVHRRTQIGAKGQCPFGTITTGKDGLDELAWEREHAPRQTSLDGFGQRPEPRFKKQPKTCELSGYFRESRLIPTTPFGRSPAKPKPSQDFGLWNERAGQCVITLRFAPRNAAYARTSPLIRLYTGQGDEFRPLAVRGYALWPLDTAFVRTRPPFQKQQ